MARVSGREPGPGSRECSKQPLEGKAAANAKKAIH